MSLDITLTAVRPVAVFDANITHNLGAMAHEAGIYEAVWRPDEIPVKKAKDLIPRLRRGIKKMKADPERFRKMEPENKWGTYDMFVLWLEKYLKACEENPDATITADR